MYTDEARAFLAFIASKGVDVKDVPDLLGAYNALSDQARQAIAGLVREQDIQPVPALWELRSRLSGPLNICLIDRAGTEHSIPSEVWERYPASPEESWLYSLPLHHTKHSPNHETTAVLQTTFSADELSFLGFADPQHTQISPEYRDLKLRADMSCAGFSDKLAYLREGKPFEIPFDPDCMNVVNRSEQSFFCDFIQDNMDIFIRPGSPDTGAFYAYGVLPDTSPVDFDLLGIKLQLTPPGKGLLSSIEGKCAWAEHRAKKARAEVMNHKSNTKAALSAGEEFLL